MRAASPVRRALRVAGVSLVLGGACLAAPRAARAGDPPPSLTAQSEAQARFQTGLKYYDARDFESARLAFTQAYAVLQKPGILLNLALSELYTNRPVDAIEHLERYLAETDLPADKRDRAKKAYDEAYKKTGHVALTVLPGTELKVDGVGLAPPLPAVLHVAPGARVLDATRGKGTKSVTLQANAGEKTNADLRIDDEAAGPMPPPAGSRPAPHAPSPETSPSGVSATTPFSSTPPPPTGAPTGTNVPRLVVGIVGAAALVGGAVAVGLSFGAKSERDDAGTSLDALAPQLPAGIGGCAAVASPVCARANELTNTYNDAENRRAGLQTAGLVAGGIGVVALAAYILWPRTRSADTAAAGSARITPGPTALGLSLVTTY